MHQAILVQMIRHYRPARVILSIHVDLRANRRQRARGRTVGLDLLRDLIEQGRFPQISNSLIRPTQSSRDLHSIRL
jgi:hypothetical protein